MKVAFFGFDLFYGCLESLIESGQDVLKIFTCKLDNVYEFSDRTYAAAKKYGIPITERKVIRQDIESLCSHGCELALSAGYYYKIPVVGGIMGVNVHPALLPVGRGPWPQPVTILKGLTRTGVTLHKLAEEFDTGDIILQSEFEITPSDNLETLTERAQNEAKGLVTRFLNDPIGLWNAALPQGKGEYWDEPSKQDFTVDLSQDYDTIDRKVRASYGYGCYVKAAEGEVYARRARCVRDGEYTADKPFMKFNICGGSLLLLE